MRYDTLFTTPDAAPAWRERGEATMACRQHAERLALVVLSCAVAASRSTGVVVDGSAEAFQATQVDARKANFFSSGFRFRLPPAVSGVIIDIGLCDQILKPGPRQHVYVP